MKASALVAGSSMFGRPVPGCIGSDVSERYEVRAACVDLQPYTLELKHVFTLASSSRSTTPVVLTQIEYGDVVGYGEASMPPYLGESHESAVAFLSKINLGKV